jgi:hypothetical protein
MELTPRTFSGCRSTARRLPDFPRHRQTPALLRFEQPLAFWFDEEEQPVRLFDGKLAPLHSALKIKSPAAFNALRFLARRQVFDFDLVFLLSCHIIPTSATGLVFNFFRGVNLRFS